MSVPQDLNTNNNKSTIDLNILDWIPIENNSDDFDLGCIIDEVERVDKQKQQTAVATTTVETPSVMSGTQFVHNHTQNYANMAQNFPFLPKMIFSNSNVTINYNFNSK